jgi:hypothetical protein
LCRGQYAVVEAADDRGNLYTTRTNPFGIFRFTGLEVGRTYVFGVRSKQFRFAPQVIFLEDGLSGIEFTALP